LSGNKIETRGLKNPGKIAYHTLTLISDEKCLLIGGSNLGIDNSNIYELDLLTFEWKLERGSLPQQLTSIDEHSTNFYEDKLYVFGGNVHGFKSNTIFVFDVKSRKWDIKE